MIRPAYSVFSQSHVFFFAPQLLCSLTKIHRKWTLCVPRPPDPPDPNVTTRGSENGREPRKDHEMRRALSSLSEYIGNVRKKRPDVCSRLQLLPDTNPPAEGKHRDGTPGSAPGCEERRPGGEHTIIFSPRPSGFISACMTACTARLLAAPPLIWRLYTSVLNNFTFCLNLGASRHVYVAPCVCVTADP